MLATTRGVGLFFSGIRCIMIVLPTGAGKDGYIDVCGATNGNN